MTVNKNTLKKKKRQSDKIKNTLKLCCDYHRKIVLMRETAALNNDKSFFIFSLSTFGLINTLLYSLKIHLKKGNHVII